MSDVVLLEKIKKDHKRISNQLKKVKKKVKKSISIRQLKSLLLKELEYSIDPRDYYYYDDSIGFERDNSKKEARIELLKELISIAEKGKR